MIGLDSEYVLPAYKLWRWLGSPDRAGARQLAHTWSALAVVLALVFLLPLLA